MAVGKKRNSVIKTRGSKNTIGNKNSECVHIVVEKNFEKIFIRLYYLFEKHKMFFIKQILKIKNYIGNRIENVYVILRKSL